MLILIVSFPSYWIYTSLTSHIHEQRDEYFKMWTIAHLADIADYYIDHNVNLFCHI